MGDETSIGAGLGSQATSDGFFTSRDMRTGAFRVRAKASATGVAGRIFGSFVVTVGPTDLSNVVLSLSPGALLQARLELEAHGGTSQYPPRSVWVHRERPDSRRDADMRHSVGAVPSGRQFHARQPARCSRDSLRRRFSHPGRSIARRTKAAT